MSRLTSHTSETEVTQLRTCLGYKRPQKNSVCTGFSAFTAGLDRVNAESNMWSLSLKSELFLQSP